MAPSTALAFFGGQSKRRMRYPIHEGPATVASALLSARRIVEAAGIGFVCTGAAGGGVDCRVMDAARLGGGDDADLRFALVTRARTRKAAALAADPRCTLAFQDPGCRGEAGYVALKGRAARVDDPRAKRAVWKDSWTPFHAPPEVASDTVVFVFEADALEVVDNDRWLRGAGWRPVTLERVRGRWRLAPGPAVRR